MATPEETQQVIVALLDRVREFTQGLTDEQIEDILSGRAQLTVVDVEPTERGSA